MFECGVVSAIVLFVFVFLLLVTMLLSGAGGGAKHNDWESPGLLKTRNKCLCCVLSIGTWEFLFEFSTKCLCQEAQKYIDN